MYNIVATFNKKSNFQNSLKILKNNPSIKGHVLIIPKTKDEYIDQDISTLLINRSNNHDFIEFKDVRFGVLIGLIIGAISSFLAVYLNINLLGISAIPFLATALIILYGGAVGSFIGFLIQHALTQSKWVNFKDETAIFFYQLNEYAKDTVIDNLKNNYAENIQVYE